MIREVLTDKWFFSFIIGWIVFLLLVDRKEIQRNIWGGIAAVALELWQDGSACAKGMYHFSPSVFHLLGVPVFFTLGVVFTMGVLFIQFVPKNPDLQMLHLLLTGTGFIVFEYIVTVNGMLVFEYWSLAGSFLDDIIIFGSFLWLKQLILSRRTQDG